MKKIIVSSFVMSLLVACTQSGVKKAASENEQVLPIDSKGQKTEKKIDEPISSEVKNVKKSETYDNGLAITWIETGEGDLLKSGEVVQIDYKVTLEDGKVIDGNHLIKKESIPFMIGFQMQTKGWDLAFNKLRVGDYVNIKIPAKLARGEQGIKKEGETGWFVPPNAINYLTVKVISKMKPTREVDGVKVWVFEENKKNKEVFNEQNAIEFHSMISTPSNPYYYNSYRERDPYTMYITDKGIVPGLKKALLGAKKADRMLVYVPSEQGYADKGLLGMVKPNEDLFYNILVLDVKEK